jgi:hypothetical protein
MRQTSNRYDPEEVDGAAIFNRTVADKRVHSYKNARNPCPKMDAQQSPLAEYNFAEMVRRNKDFRGCLIMA